MYNTFKSMLCDIPYEVRMNLYNPIDLTFCVFSNFQTMHFVLGNEIMCLEPWIYT